MSTEFEDIRLRRVSVIRPAVLTTRSLLALLAGLLRMPAAMVYIIIIYTMPAATRARTGNRFLMSVLRNTISRCQKKKIDML